MAVISFHPPFLGVRLMRSRHVMVAATLLLSAACMNDSSPTRPQPTQAAVDSVTTAPCEFRAVKGEPPSWARTGFTPGVEMHYASSSRGDMLAILFGYPLYSPPLPDRGNKILWRSRAPLVPSEPLRIEARLNGVGAPTRITVEGGPGPSAVDLPSPGCWRLDLAWSSHTDSIDLEFVSR
ncbi:MULTISPECIES: hypothetical protein [Nonomuraea]|uniref:Secreted protein n=1 Tax=Nonomuraea ferruginea TaxID=46174 RepID=A0ABT4T0J1_9ACTN|nr:hypothetical protein [Nonomuraea ferruginea]MDA0643014.1 hypothetical protein [Nonomuraea ferruginea]